MSVGRRVYNMHCYFCHGYSGDAKTVASSYLEPPPRNFTASDPQHLSRQQMITVVTAGKPGTAMMSFKRQLTADEINAVVEYVRSHFMINKVADTIYHTLENGWHDFQRYASAFPFVSGEIAIDALDAVLTVQQQQGKRLFINTCLTCHEGRSDKPVPLQLDARAVSYPRGAYSHKKDMIDSPDAISAATPYAQHDQLPVVTELTVQQQRGEQLFQANCAFCHAADGTGKNWIGSFLEPHPRNLTDTRAMQNMTEQRLKNVIRNGVEGTTMSAWRAVLSEEQIDAVVAYVMRVFVRESDER